MRSADDPMRRFVDLGDNAAAAWDGTAVAEAVCASTSRAADAMAAVMTEAAAAVGSLTTVQEWVEWHAKSCSGMLASSEAPPLLDLSKFSALALLAEQHAAREMRKPRVFVSSSSLDQIDAKLSAVKQALEAVGADVALSEEEDEWARYVAGHLVVVAPSRAGSPGRAAVLDQVFREYCEQLFAAPLWKALPQKTRVARLKRFKERALWFVVRLKKRRIRDEKYRRLRALQTDNRLDIDLVTVQMAYFLTHGCHPPPLRRSRATFRGATCTC